MVLIFGNDYSLTIIMPFILIILGIAFFLTTYIKDNIGKLKLKVKKKEKHEKEAIDFNHEFIHLKKEIPNMNATDSLDAITSITKQFLGHKLNIQNEFTFEELPRNKLDWQVIEFTKRLTDLRYSGREITRDEINHLVIYLSKILKFKDIDYGKKEDAKPGIFPRIIFPKFPKIIFKFPQRKKPHERIPHPHKELKPIKINLKLPSRIVINPFMWFKTKKKIEVPIPKREAIKKSIIELRKQAVSHISKTEHKKTKSKLYKFVQFIHREENNISNLESRSLRKFLKNSHKLSKDLSKSYDEESHKTIVSMKNVLSHANLEHKIPEAPMPVKIEHAKKIHHKHKIGFFEKLRMSRQSSRILKLIKKAESISFKHPLVSKKLYDEALMMYYRLPMDKEEDIAIKLDKFYGKINGNHERDLMDIKHNDKKATREAISKLKEFRNHSVAENNSLSISLRSSVSELKKKLLENIIKTKDNKIKSRFSKFLKIVSNKESEILALDEGAINNIMSESVSLFSRVESEGYDVYFALKNLFSNLRMELPSNLKMPVPEINVPKEIPRFIEPEIKKVKIKAPEIRVIPKQKLEIQPPRYPEKKISDRMKKLIEEKESVYKKLKEVEGQELERFKNVKRMTIHEDIGYHDFIRNLKPRTEHHEEHKLKKILEAK